MLRILFKKRSLATSSAPLKKTPLYDLHLKHQGKMVDFAGWLMPLQYPSLSIINSVKHTREKASVFDVSHMLQFNLKGKDSLKFFESLCVADLHQLKPEESVLSVLVNGNGGIVDDMIVNKKTNELLYVVSNAGCAEKDLKFIRGALAKFKGDVRLDIIENTALLAIQGPLAAPVLKKLSGENLSSFAFMTTRRMKVGGIDVHVSRSGYTGEDGFEIQVGSKHSAKFAEMLLNEEGVEWAGLGARDTLRLEAGMCLYGHDLDEETTPVEAGLTWTIGKRRRAEGGFNGSEFVLPQLAKGAKLPKRRIGLIVEGAPAREGALIYAEDGALLGKVTSGCPSPNLGKNVAMGYVKGDGSWHKSGTKLKVEVRKKMQDAVVTKMPFVETKYHKV
ncbi:hypothetical protein MP638_007433 [Amoeboaphelidium occidentale]|nr:hypothetical protein MP638_007433 [Amoeboaphelidium occidentale]